MRVAVTHNFLLELVRYLGRGDTVVGVGSDSDESGLPVFADHGSVRGFGSAVKLIDDSLRSVNPDILFTGVRPDLIGGLSREASRILGRDVTIECYHPYSLEQILDGIESVAGKMGVSAKGRDLGQRIKAQIFDWSSNFYERTRAKKVSVLAGIDPFILGGGWIADIVGQTSAVPHRYGDEPGDVVCEWKDIVDFNPDVLLVAPFGASLAESMRAFLKLEKLPGWDTIWAVKRGEVYFIAGDSGFYDPGTELLNTAGIIVSAIAGLESGYITPRDSFHRLRHLEMFRHKL